jgi:hypothetical protein
MSFTPAEGNSWDPKVVENCRVCGPKIACRTCHRHGEPRGKCPECPPERKKLDGAKP